MRESDASSPDFAPIGHISFGEFYNGILAKVTSGYQTSKNAAEAQNAIVSSLESKLASQTGVDLNEELTDLVRFQTAYEASAKVFSICNELMDTILMLGE